MSDEKDIYQTFSLQELDAEEARMRELYELHPSNVQHPDMFGVLEDSQHLDIYWSGEEYSIELAALEKPEELLWWLHHILEKGWPYVTGLRVHRLIECLARLNNWEMYRRTEDGPGPRTTSDAVERGKLTPKLRYEVLLRDNFRCRACGASAETGAHLHIDHIVSIANGGRTVFENLQALCSPCNFGKGGR